MNETRTQSVDARHLRQPLLLRVGTYVSGFMAIVWLSLVPLAAFNLGSYSINRQAVSARYFLTHAGPLLLPLAGALACLAFGLAKRRSWTRPLMLGLWGTIILVFVFLNLREGTALESENVGAFIELVVLTAIAAWYLYGKANVVAYYRTLEASRPATRGTSNPIGTDSPSGV